MCDRIETAKKILNTNFHILKGLYPNFRYSSIRIRKEDRRLVLVIYFLQNGHFVRKGTQVSKLFLEIKLNRILNVGETTDHIDGCVENDNLENLQMLTISENSSKGSNSFIKQKTSKKHSAKMKTSFGDYCRGENNNFHKLSEKEVKEIKEIQRAYFVGSNQDVDLASKFNVSRKTISAIRLNKTWKHI